MEYRKIAFIVLFILVSQTSCFDVDFRGMFYSSIDVNKRFSDSQIWNENHDLQKIKIEGDEYKFIVAGDSHVGGTENLKVLIEEANKPEYAFFSICGDVTTGKKDDYEVFNNTLTQFCSSKYFLIAGNHDLYFKGWETYFEIFGSSSYYAEIETNNSIDLLIFLDTGSATLGKNQTEWLEDLLENKREKYRKCFIFSHVNFFRVWGRKSGSTNFLIEELEYLLALFHENNVDFVFSGHDHRRYEVEFGSTKYITLDALKDEHKTPSYLVVESKNDEISYHFVEIM